MKSFKIVLVCALLVLISGGYVARSRAAAKITAAKIAAANRGAALFAELSKLPTGQAKDRYLSLSPEERREVWRAKLKAIRLDRLNEDQAAVVRDTLAALDVISFDERDRDKHQEKIKALHKRSLEAFEEEDAKIIFATLLNYEIFKSALPQPGDCECSTDTDFCGRRWVCCEGCVGCRTHSVGCGFVWFQQCNGMCFKLS